MFLIQDFFVKSKMKLMLLMLNTVASNNIKAKFYILSYQIWFSIVKNTAKNAQKWANMAKKYRQYRTFSIPVSVLCSCFKNRDIPVFQYRYATPNMYIAHT